MNPSEDVHRNDLTTDTDEEQVTFSVEKSLEPWAEAVWREWWRRSGIPRQDFQANGAKGTGKATGYGGAFF